MLKRFALAFALSFGAAPLVQAQQERSADALFDLMMMPELIEIMQGEGLEYGASIGEDLLGGAQGAQWEETVGRIYDVERMEESIRAQFILALGDANLPDLFAFYSSEMGQEILSLEVSAREAMVQEEVEEAAREFAAIAMADETPRFALVEEFADVNDLIERNVTGGLNSNYAFLRGLSQGGGFGGSLTDDQILSDVWAQEPEIRTNTTEWVFSFLMLAYQPLSDSELSAYIAFATTEEGQDINRALFEAFNAEFDQISYALGFAAAEQMRSTDL